MPSAELELNIYSAAHVGYGFETNGVTGTYLSPGSVNLQSGDPINITMYYANGQMALTFTDAVANTSFVTNLNVGDLTQALGTNTAYVGFTGSDGGSTSVQTISNFSFASIPPAAIQYGNSKATISWPGGTPGFTLQQNSDLSSTDWTDVARSPVLTNGTNQITIHAGTGNMFYRLVLP